jgi:predicted small metal-binding protein
MELITELRQKANELAEVMKQVKPSRESALGFTNIEQGMMWMIKAVCLEQEQENEKITN